MIGFTVISLMNITWKGNFPLYRGFRNIVKVQTAAHCHVCLQAPRGYAQKSLREHLSDHHRALFRAFMANMAISVSKPDVIFVLGQPGAGKGTQCARIVSVSVRKHE